jgi:predicted deacylase
MSRLAELNSLEALVANAQGLVRAEVIEHVRLDASTRLPIYALRIGSDDRSLPTLGIFAGVHGLERVGTSVALAWLESLVENLRWDAHFRARLERCRVVAIPLINPGGMALGRRSNPAGVDLMRNAPHDAQDRVPFLLGGHRYGPHLPWYRGPEGAPMQPEAQALCDFVQRELFDCPAAFALDVHSGFGARDRLWYPWARSTEPFVHVAAARRVVQLLDRTYPNHVYKVEAQSDSYTTHGDLWDHLALAHEARHGAGGPVFLPWTLELGSWTWVRKNPRQLFMPAGPFNPVIPHRLERALRRHMALIDLLLRAVHNFDAWR